MTLRHRGWVFAALVLLATVSPASAADRVTVPPRGTDLADAWVDTLHVAAPRVTLDEIIADIGRRQRANRDSLRSVAFTAVVTAARSPGGRPPGAADSAGTRYQGDWELEETALRYEQERGRPDRIVRLWERKQSFRDGVPQQATEKTHVKPAWRPRPMEMVDDLPFAEGGAKLYRYELLESRLVGGSLVHVVAFAPRDRFAPLPSGTIWVDIADWAIRRVDARFGEAVPFPWVIRAIPHYRQRQAPCGAVWFPMLETARVEMRDLPLAGGGGTWDLKVELRDIVINGEPCDGAVGTASDDEAGAALFWAAIDDLWDADMPAPLRQPSSLATARLDSLSREGARALAAMPERPPVGVRLRPAGLAFNRAQGLAPRVGATIGRLGGALRLDTELGSGLDDRRVLWGAGLSVRAAAGLTLRAGAARTTPAFAGDGRTGQRSWSALLWGSDPNHYFDRTTLAASARWQRGRAAAPRAWLEAGWSQARELELAVHQRWNVLGRALRPEGMVGDMLAADAVDLGTLRVDGGARLGALTVGAGVASLAVSPRVAGYSGGESDLVGWHWSARWQRPDALGNRWTLRTGGRGVDGAAPSQHRVWLGDWRPDGGGGAGGAGAGSLCGWPAGSLLGDRGAWASFELDLNVDPWRALRVPRLRGLQLRPLVFAEWAAAWGQAGEAWPDADGLAADGRAGVGVRGAGAPPTGSRADVGLGFSRRVDLPLVGIGSRVELRAARAVGEAAGGREWRFVVGIGR
jgi:hypothetical protein